MMYQELENANFVGHTCPDTDAVISAICAAHFFNGKAYVQGQLNKETIHVLNCANVQAPENLTRPLAEKIVLVDHNSIKQSTKHIKPEGIIGIIDHHTFENNIPFTVPRSIVTRPVGCTATILFDLYRYNQRTPDKTQALLLLSAILSDTLLLKSPTTTELDRDAVNELAHISNTDINSYGMAMLSAKSDLQHVPIEELLTLDFKEFNSNNKAYGIGVIETVSPELILEKEQELLRSLKNSTKKLKLDFILFVVVDVINQESYSLITDNHQHLLEKLSLRKSSKFRKSNFVSRKLELLPYLQNALR